MLKDAGLGLALLAGFALALYGFVTIAWAQLPWRDSSDLLWLWVYLLGLGGATAVLARLRRWDFPRASLCLLGAAAFLAGEWLALLFLPLFALSACSLGRALTRRLGRADADPLLDGLLGAGLLGTVVGLLAHFPLARPPVYAALLLAPLLFAPASARQSLAALRAGLDSWRPATAGRTRGGDTGGLPLLALCALGLLHALVAFLPELGHDALAMHLFVPTYMEHHRLWTFDPSTYAWALMPMLGDWLYALIYILAGESATRLLNVGFILALAALSYRLARWLGAGPRPALWAALLYLSMPLTFAESSSLFIDAFWSACLVAAALSLLESRRGEAATTAALAGLFIGLALAAKLGSTTFLPLLALCGAYALRRDRALARAPNLLRFTLPLLLLGGIPYGTAWLISGNPVFPFFNAVFQSPYFPPVDFESNFPPYLAWDLPWQMIFGAERFIEGTAGTPGFQWLLLPAAALVALLSGKRRALLLLAAGLGTVLLTFSAQGYLRYVFAALLLLGCVLALPLQASRPAVRRLALALTALCVMANLSFLPAGTWTYRELPLGLIGDARARAAFLERNAPLRLLMPLINAHNSTGRPVAFVATAAGVAGLQADALITNWYNERLRQGLDDAVLARDPRRFAQLLSDEGAELIVLDELAHGSEFNTAIHGIADPLARRGHWALLRLHEEFRFGGEKLRNGDLQGPADWELEKGALFSPETDAFIVSESAPAWQRVAVKPLREFLLRMESACHEERVRGRLQVNWYDEDRDYLGSSIDIFDCSETPTWRELVVQSPRKAASGLVFLSSDESRPLRVYTVSFR